MQLTDEQRAIVEHSAAEHLVVRAVPGSGKTTTLVHRAEALVRGGVAPSSIQVVMFNRSVQATCRDRLAAMGVPTGAGGVKVNTFDSLARRLIHRAIDFGWTRDLHFEERGEFGKRRRLDVVHRELREDIEDVEDLERAIDFWRAHLVSPKRARMDANPALVEGYRRFEELRTQDGIRLDVGDYNYTAYGILKKHGRIEDPPTHLLIDEFQDVNPARVALMQGLAGPATRIVAVGDEDQGINEWCGSHPRYFREFAARFPSLPTQVLPLSTSFRLGAVLAGAANALVRHNVERAPAEIVPAGAVPGSAEVCAELPAGLKALFAQGVRPGELAVLYRSRLEGAHVLSALARAKVPIATEDAYLLKKGAGPELLRSFLRAAFADTLARPDQVWTLVRASCEYVRKEAFASGWARDSAGGLRRYLRDGAWHREAGQLPNVVRGLADLARVLDRIAAAATTKAAVRIIDEACEVDTVLRTPSRSLRSQDQAVACYESLCDWLSSQSFPPAEADAAIESLDLGLGQPGEACVYANTVHKAKGLEWPVVVVAGVYDGGFPAEEFGERPGSVDQPEGFEQSPFLEQERRTFYVAMTRAKARLLIHRPPDTVSRFFEELRAGVPALAPPRRAPPKTVGGATKLRKAPEPPPAGGKAWTDADDAALAKGWENGLGCIALSAQFGRSTGGIVRRLVRLGVVESRDEARRRV